MRKVYLTPNFPPTSDDVAAAAAAGATEIVQGTGGFKNILDPSETLQGRLAALADLRYQATLTTTWRGVQVPCDTAAATNVLGAVIGLQLANSTGPILWKVSPGNFQSLNLADIIDLGETMRAHVQACFVYEQALTISLTTAPDAMSLIAVDVGSGWPK